MSYFVFQCVRHTYMNIVVNNSAPMRLCGKINFTLDALQASYRRTSAASVIDEAGCMGSLTTARHPCSAGARRPAGRTEITMGRLVATCNISRQQCQTAAQRASRHILLTTLYYSTAVRPPADAGRRQPGPARIGPGAIDQQPSHQSARPVASTCNRHRDTAANIY